MYLNLIRPSSPVHLSSLPGQVILLKLTPRLTAHHQTVGVENTRVPAVMRARGPSLLTRRAPLNLDIAMAQHDNLEAEMWNYAYSKVVNKKHMYSVRVTVEAHV